MQISARREETGSLPWQYFNRHSEDLLYKSKRSYKTTYYMKEYDRSRRSEKAQHASGNVCYCHNPMKTEALNSHAISQRQRPTNLPKLKGAASSLENKSGFSQHWKNCRSIDVVCDSSPACANTCVGLRMDVPGLYCHTTHCTGAYGGHARKWTP